MSDFLRVYKFYSSSSALRNLSERRLKVSLVDELNDPFEFLGYYFPNRKLRKAWFEVRRTIFEDKGVICFSESWSNPVLWSHYADKHDGLALGFDVPKKFLLKVMYLEDRPVFDVLNWPSEERNRFVQQALGQKFSHWSYEQEQRIFVPLSECVRENGLWFRPFDQALQLKEVVIGARCSKGSDEIRNAVGQPDLPIVTARLAFRSFGVVQQLNRRLQK